MSDTLRTVPTASVRTRPQVRGSFDDDSVAGLAASIRASGLQQPILCQEDAKGMLWVIDGHRRLRACQLAGLREVPVLVIAGELGDSETLSRQLVCNLQRLDLNPIEQAEGLRALMEHSSQTATKVAAMLGLSEASVARSLKLLTLPIEVRDRVAKGEIPADAAYQLARVEDGAEQASLAAKVASKQLTRDGLVRRLRQGSGKVRTPRPRRARASFLLGEHGSLTFTGPALTLNTAIEMAEQLALRARQAKAQGQSLAIFARTLRKEAVKAGRTHAHMAASSQATNAEARAVASGDGTVGMDGGSALVHP